MLEKTFKQSAIAAIVIGLSACGGGGGESASPSPIPTPTPTNIYTVTSQSTTGGLISPSTAEVEEGRSQTFTITPDDGYYIASASGCDENGYYADFTFYVNDVSEDCTFDVEFTRQEDIRSLVGTFHYSDHPETHNDMLNTNELDEMYMSPDWGVIPTLSRMTGYRYNILPTFDGVNDYGVTVEEMWAIAELRDNEGSFLGYNNSAPLELGMSLLEVRYDFNQYWNVAVLSNLAELELADADPRDIGGAFASVYPKEVDVNGNTYSLNTLSSTGRDGIINSDGTSTGRGGSPDLFGHEFGHNLGIEGHSGSYWCGEFNVSETVDTIPFSFRMLGEHEYSEECRRFAYGDGYGFMGGYRDEVNAVWKLDRGWLTEAQVIVAEGQEQTSVIEASDIHSFGDKLVRVDLTDPNMDDFTYFVSYKTDPIRGHVEGRTMRETDAVFVRLKTDGKASFFRSDFLPDFSSDLKQNEVDRFISGGDTHLFGDGQGNNRTVLELGESFHDRYRGIRFTHVANAGLTGLDRAEVRVEQSNIRFTHDKQGDATTVEFINDNETDVTVSNVSLHGINLGPFSITSDSCSEATLLAGESCSVVVSGSVNFKPTGTALIFNNNDTLRPKASIDI